MKTLILKTTIFLSPLILTFLIMEFLVDNSVLYSSSKVYSTVSDYLEMKENVRILVFGSSHADNAISEDYRPYVFNMANQGQDLKYDLFLLDIIEDINNVEVVVLTFSYFSFEYSEDKVWPYRVRDYLDAQSLRPAKSLFKLDDWLYDHSDLINHNMSFNRIITYYCKRILTPRNKKRNLSDLRKTTFAAGNRNQKVSNLDEDAENRAIRVHSSYYNTSFEVIAQHIDEMINKCLLSKKKVVAVVPPFHRAYNTRLSAERVKTFRQRMDWIHREYDICILDYSHDRRFAEEDSLFVNCDHLNRVGAKKFTEILIKDIIQVIKIHSLSSKSKKIL